MKPRVGVVQFQAICPEGNEHPLASGITYEIARRMSVVGGVDASAIVPGRGAPVPGAVGEGHPEGTAPGAALSAEKATGLSVPSLGAQFESDYIVIGQAHVADGLLLHYRVYEAENGRVLADRSLSGLRSDVFRLLDELARGVRTAIGFFSDEAGAPEIDPVYDSVDFEAFVEFCLAREATVPQNALGHLERALRREPTFRMALVEYLSQCYQADEMSASLQHLDEYLERFPQDQEVLIAAANLCLAFNIMDAGLGYARRSLACGSDVEPNVLMARFLFAKEMTHDATRHLEAALASPDASAEASYCLGRYFLDLGDVYRSRDFFEKCLAADPGYLVAQRDLQCCYYELGDFALAVDACEQLLEADPADAGSYYNLGLVYQRQGRSSLAVKYFEEAVHQDPTFYKAIYMVGEYLHARGEFEPALERFEAAHRLAPTSAEALGRIGDCHYELGRPREALRHYTRARREDPVWESARHRLIAGCALAADGDLAAAQEHLRKAAELEEDLAEAWSELGGVLLRMGRSEDALAAVRRAAELRPEHAGVRANVLACIRRLPLGVRLSGWARRLARETRGALATLRREGVLPSASARRRFRRGVRTLTWYAFRG